jgi:uncharacterized protein
LYMFLPHCQPRMFENDFAKMAQEQSKEVFGFEKVAEQLSLLDKVPLKKQMTVLVEQMKDIPKSEKEIAAINLAFQQNDLNAFAKSIENNDWGAIRGYEENMLYSRNRTWFTTIETEMKKKSTFIAVGAQHLSGDKGLVAMLKAAGYTLRPMVEEKKQ